MKASRIIKRARSKEKLDLSKNSRYALNRDFETIEDIDNYEEFYTFDKDTSLNLQCECGNELSIYREDYTEKKENITITNSIILKCKKCLKKYKTIHLFKIINEIKKQGRKNVTIDFSFFNDLLYKDYTVEEGVVKFIYDKDDYFNLPGLERNHNIGFLTPVYFKYDVLLKYKYDPHYSIKINSTTYSSITFEREWNIPFGINSNNRVIMWLGDILALPLEEQFYLRSFNILSDHHLQSAFYDGQINVVWAKKSNEQRLFEAKKNLFEAIKSKYNIDIMSYFDETEHIFSTINKPIFNSRKAFDNEIIDLNKVFSESFSKSELKKYIEPLIKDNEKEVFNNYGSLKLLCLFVINKLNYTNEESMSLLSPIFVLTDLRNCAGHLKNQENYESKFKECMKYLGLSEDESDFLKIYNVLIIKLRDTFENLFNLLNQN